jgi:hypothetical protein
VTGQSRPEYGTIAGVVLDKHNLPMRGMVVRAERHELHELHIGLVPQARTNAKGQFVLHGLPVGTYIVYAGKESRGYPERPASLYLDQPQAHTAEVRHDSTTGVRIMLGDALGRIRGSVTELRSKRPVKSANIKLSIASDPSRFLQASIEADGRFFVVVPSEAMNIEVLAEGYNVHQVEGTLRTLDMIQVRRGAVEQIRIKLRAPR